MDKFEERRRELADAALRTLAEVGYAQTSLRTIAQNTEFTHGVLHYYFEDKDGLIAYCVRQFKADCVSRYDGLVADAGTPAELAVVCGQGLAATLVDDAVVHRLWYDLRTQAMFDKAFRDDVAEIDESLQGMTWRVVEAYAELTGTEPTCTPSMAYALFDGLFERALRRHLAGSDDAAGELGRSARDLLPRLFV